eukprot:TRINITY_DN680_c0_g1_i1.p1 TRINITY_DN680_c0_g1~~TRINITY_DN680_c0_g1_i1.p1  ORF type:complete len:286 (+),score=52.92 TRINITY_DN680_c0_g1_i1:184-1041(+)
MEPLEPISVIEHEKRQKNKIFKLSQYFIIEKGIFSFLFDFVVIFCVALLNFGLEFSIFDKRIPIYGITGFWVETMVFCFICAYLSWILGIAFTMRDRRKRDLPYMFRPQFMLKFQKINSMFLLEDIFLKEKVLYIDNDIGDEDKIKVGKTRWEKAFITFKNGFLFCFIYSVFWCLLWSFILLMICLLNEKLCKNGVELLPSCVLLATFCALEDGVLSIIIGYLALSTPPKSLVFNQSNEYFDDDYFFNDDEFDNDLNLSYEEDLNLGDLDEIKLDDDDDDSFDRV